MDLDGNTLMVTRVNEDPLNDLGEKHPEHETPYSDVLVGRPK